MMKSFNLLTEHWIPVRRADGSRCRIPPWRITERDTTGTPFVDIDMARPDFKGALLEFLIGLIQTALPPANDKDWLQGFQDSPDPESLRTALTPLERAFNLFGPRPCFLQDLTLTEAQAKEPSPIASLLLDTPGENASRFNSDFFIKRDQPPDCLCPACAAMALLAMQAYAPSGGVGYRVSMRGGGPLTTVIRRDTLWETIWANILPLSAPGVEPLPDALPESVFPWLAPTRTSEAKGSELHSDGMPFLHHYWGMPRRIVLVPGEDDTPSVCPVCGETGQIFVRQYWAKNYGINYGTGWRHPLTPYRAQGPGKDALTLKGVSEGRGYNQWLGLVYGDDAKEKFPVKPARCSDHYAKSMHGKPGEVIGRIRTFGYDMDKMKPRNWCEGEFPVYDLGSGDPKQFIGEITPLLKAAELACGNLKRAVREALFTDAARDAKSDATLLKDVETRFWSATRAAFYERVETIIVRLDDEDTLIKGVLSWRDLLLATVDTLFKVIAEDGGGSPKKAQQIYAALNRMRAFTRSGCSKLLGIPLEKEAKKQ